MTIFPLTHESGDKDLAYRRPDNSILVTIGAFSYASDLKINDYSDSEPYGTAAGEISIGRFCSLGSEITIILGGSHDHQAVTTSPMVPLVEDHRAAPQNEKARVLIGNDVWIGNNVIIISDVRIGDGAVIGAGSVITKDVPPFSVVVGNPGRVAKYRFAEKTVRALLEIRWWDWRIDEIKAHLDDLRGHDIDGFIEKALCRASRTDVV